MDERNLHLCVGGTFVRKRNCLVLIAQTTGMDWYKYPTAPQFGRVFLGFVWEEKGA